MRAREVKHRKKELMLYILICLKKYDYPDSKVLEHLLNFHVI